MNRIRHIFCGMLTLTLLLTTSSAMAQVAECGPAQEVSDALLCKEKNCPQLNQENAQGYTADQAYFAYCSNYGIEFRSTRRDASLAAVISDLERIRFPEPPTLTPPCECLAMLKNSFGVCEVEQCPSPEAAKTSTPEKSAPTTEIMTDLGNPVSAGGCSLQNNISAAAASNLWTWGFAILSLPSAMRLLKKKSR